jgi:tetratricopeptide (TPR) repeat protein
MLRRELASRTLFALTVLLLSVTAAVAAGTVKGTITDAEGNPIEDVEVKLQPTEDNPGIPASTVESDDDGRYIFGLVRKGTYRVLAFKDGMRVSHLDINIATPKDDSLWAFDGKVGPAVAPPKIAVSGEKTVSYDMQMKASGGGGGEWGTGVPLMSMAEIVEMIQAGNADEAESELERQLDTRPDSPNLHYLMGFLKLQQGEMGAARRAVGKALEIDPSLQGANLLMGKILERQGNKEKALEHFDKEVEQSTDENTLYEALLAKGVLLEREGELEKAAEVLEEALAIRPDELSVMRELGNIYAELGQKEKASEYVQKVKQAGGAEDPNVLYNVGVSHWSSKEFEQAKQQFAKAVELKPDFAEAHLMLAKSQLNTGETQAALEHLKEYLALQPEGPEAEWAKQIIGALEAQGGS